ncbi:single-stranded DNA-binding protein [Candidatus Peregrinibacteria bacterium HGW-Peregrinibacteria-1]|jgi:single-strand DNA-binding protein|nr:MAG: single-stranded DNA-binding protein [Candidatus Peregrinibacteria bacterium HGW-Peregrinibacteria-1]
MRSVNKVILIGNLTRDPVMKTTQGGQVITSFGIATNREWTTNDSDRKKSTEFHEVVAWAKLGEICNEYLKKGKLVYIEGYLKTRIWEEDESKEKRYRTEIVAQDMIMLNKRGDGSDDGDDEYTADNNEGSHSHGDGDDHYDSSENMF